jgi:hypothetical protein
MSTFTTINSQFLNDFGKIWKQFCNQGNNGNWESDPWGESFELLGAALIYSYNGFVNYSEDRLHSIIHPASSKCLGSDRRIPWKPVLGEERRIPSFASSKGQGLSATMHLASSSFRISTALAIILKNWPNNFSPLYRFFNKNSGDWNRVEVGNNLNKLDSLNCCNNSGAVLTDEIALIIIVAHRDEFGHGEIGIGGGPNSYRNNREKHFGELYPCRIVQAQLKLVELGLNEFAKLPK